MRLAARRRGAFRNHKGPCWLAFLTHKASLIWTGWTLLPLMMAVPRQVNSTAGPTGQPIYLPKCGLPSLGLAECEQRCGAPPTPACGKSVRAMLGPCLAAQIVVLRS